MIFALLSMAYTLACAQSAGHIDPTMGFVNNTTPSIEGRDVKQLSNGSIIVCGSTKPFSTKEGYLAEFSPNGTYLAGTPDAQVASFFACDTINANDFVAVGKGLANSATVVLAKVSPLYSSSAIDLSTMFLNLDVFDIVTQRDGKFVICGFASPDGISIKFWVARFKSDMTIDSSFGTNGHVLLSFGSNAQARSLALQTDGKIVIAGHSVSQKQSIVARLNTSGQLDNTFFGNGYKLSVNSGYSNELYSVSVDANNTIYTVGVIAAPANPQTQLNIINASSQQQDILVATSAKWYTLALQNDSGKVVIAGQSGPDGTGKTVPIVFRYRRSSTGYAFDNGFSGFGNMGLYTTGITSASQDACFGTYFQRDGKVLLCGTFNGRIFLTRLNGDPLSTGINQAHAAEIPVIIGPNPTSDRFSVYSSQAVKCLSVTDISGREIPYTILGDNSYSLSGKGIYLVRIETEKGQIITKRVVVE